MYTYKYVKTKKAAVYKSSIMKKMKAVYKSSIMKK